MLTASQIRWAAQHDWFVRDNGDGTIRVADSYSDGACYVIDWGYPVDDDDGADGCETFAELRAWAGY